MYSVHVATMTRIGSALLLSSKVRAFVVLRSSALISSFQAS